MAKKPRSEREHQASKYGTDKQYLEWVTYQPSCLNGAFNQWQDGVGRNIPCHVRRASIAGTAFKPPFSAVPMTDEQHQMQGTQGERAVLEKFLIGHPPRGYSEEAAKFWFDQAAEEHLQRWIHYRQHGEF